MTKTIKEHKRTWKNKIATNHSKPLNRVGDPKAHVLVQYYIISIGGLAEMASLHVYGSLSLVMYQISVWKKG